jgi:type I restriction enzyme S subunit
MNQSCYGLSKPGTSGTFAYFTTQQLITRLRQHAHGSVFDTITRDTFARVFVASPPSALIETFESLASPLLAQMHAALLNSRSLKSSRDTLLPKLISGELRVKDTERPLETVL